MDLFDTLLEEGVKTREEGNPKAAIAILTKAIPLAQDEKELAGLLGQVALCHQHLQNFDQAKNYYDQATYLAQKVKDYYGIVRIKRQQSAIALEEGYLIKAINLACQAKYDLNQLQPQPNDACHVTHGVIKVLLEQRRKTPFLDRLNLTGDILYWLWIEAREVRTMMKQEKSDLNRYVWLTGFIADLAYSLPPITYPFGLIGLYIAKKHHLGLRIKQFEKSRF